MASTYLTRNPGSAGNRKKWTFSAWVKKAGLGSAQAMFTAGFSANNVDTLQFDATDQISWFSYDGNTDYAILTNAKFRDVNAWYHIQAVLDTGNATANDRVILYVNGERQSLATNTMPSQDYNGIFNNNSTAHYIGQYGWNSNAYFDGEMSHIHFSDGYALAPTVFGETDSTTGEWQINTFPSFTLGTNGFTILKDGMTITDQSTNSNNWTLGGGTLTKTEDNPSNVFATWNSLFRKGTSTPAFSNGNLTSTFDDAGANEFALTTLGASSGKYYAEIKWVSATGTGATSTGILDMGYSGTADPNNAVTNTFAYFGNGNKNVSGSASSYGSSYTSGDIIGIAMDLDNNKLYFSKNGTWQNSGDPTSGATGTGAISTIAGVTYGFMTSDYNNKVCQLNTGNGYFGTTAVASAGTNASGNGIFEYDVPTGYTALSTEGLNS